MDRHFYEKVFSTQRMDKYFNRYPNDEAKAIVHYKTNIELSEAFYAVLSMYEVAFRNSLNRELTEYFGTVDWYLKIASVSGLKNLNGSIQTAQKHIANRNETITANKVIAELTMGFWVRLFNAEYELILWKPLRKAFPYLEKSERQRNNVSAPINKIRDFRNRVFHHEPISWNLYRLIETHERILKVMGWLNEDLPKVAKEIDRVPNIIKNARQSGI
ncbi:Abi family protein [Aequorivita vladivostokensis]|uniref:Abi family protein n=1 Tax=Aequorivita vladivostokensis TaxID=171194 RepID=UPI000A0640E6|nr:Abi family protein [Aequorivita vladivostokensis]